MFVSWRHSGLLCCAARLVGMAAVVAATICGRFGRTHEPTPATSPSTSGTFVAVVRDGRAVLSLNGRTVLEYMFPDNGPKSYVKILTSPSGINVLRDSPPDHVHHHGLMFALGVDSVDYWAEGPEFGSQVSLTPPRVHTEIQNGRAIAKVRHDVRWVDPQGRPQLSEERELIWHLVEGGFPSHLLVWHCRLRIAGEDPHRTLWGRHYFGLGCRFVEAMDRAGRFSNSKGETGVTATNDKAAEWCAYSAAVNGQPITLVMFDHPNNPRHPAVWFTMDTPFAYLSATLDLAKQKYPLKAGEVLELRYGVAVSDAHLNAQQIWQIHRSFLALTQD